MNKNFHRDLMILSGHVYKNENFNIPEGWKEISSYSDNNGFQASIYQKDNEIVISYRGTDSLRDFFINDIPMVTKIRPEQYQNANALYQEIKQYFSNFNITVTGHSLGGSLAQMVSAKNGCPAVTFNAFGTKNILQDLGYNNKMTPDEFMEKEGEIMGQLQSIGLPQKSDLPPKYYNATNGDGKWVTINGNHVFIEK